MSFCDETKNIGSNMKKRGVEIWPLYGRKEELFTSL